MLEQLVDFGAALVAARSLTIVATPYLREARALTEAGAVKVVKKEMAQGQKQSRFIAWTFMDNNKRRK